MLHTLTVVNTLNCLYLTLVLQKNGTAMTDSQHEQLKKKWFKEARERRKRGMLIYEEKKTRISGTRYVAQTKKVVMMDNLLWNMTHK